MLSQQFTSVVIAHDLWVCGDSNDKRGDEEECFSNGTKGHFSMFYNMLSDPSKNSSFKSVFELFPFDMFVII